MNDHIHSPMERLANEMAIIHALPPLPYFTPDDEAAAVEVVTGGVEFGSSYTAILELLDQTVRGGSWGSPATRRETFRSRPILDRVLTAGRLDVDELYSCLATVAACELELTQPNLSWWLIQRPDILAVFSSRDVHAVSTPPEILSATISAELWDHLEGLANYGLPWETILREIKRHEALLGFPMSPSWKARVAVPRG